ncbi:hypothetical protein [Hymenobacter arizonensis]|uniref:hypothetical protein n=1 Tax=Hymenobacter arizonensis TaxID=1227077 RepID=UPI000B83D12A|nr:hypothetical protein [Hymenobacter arizonensis]
MLGATLGLCGAVGLQGMSLNWDWLMDHFHTPVQLLLFHTAVPLLLQGGVYFRFTRAIPHAPSWRYRLLRGAMGVGHLLALGLALAFLVIIASSLSPKPLWGA